MPELRRILKQLTYILLIVISTVKRGKKERFKNRGGCYYLKNN